MHKTKRPQAQTNPYNNLMNSSKNTIIFTDLEMMHFYIIARKALILNIANFPPKNRIRWKNIINFSQL